MKQKILKLYDKNHNPCNPIMKYKEFCIESTLSTGDRVLSFQILKNLSKEIEFEGYIENETDEFVIKEISTSGIWKIVTCNLNVEGLENTVFSTFNNEGNLKSCMDKVIAGTGWTYENKSTSTKTRTLKKDGCSSWEIIQQVRKSYAVEFKFDSKAKKITIYDTRGSDKGVFFLEDLNLKDLSIQGNSYDFYTKIVAYGKDDLTVTVTDNTYSNKVKTLYWKDERYTDKASLTEDATLKLKQYSTPYIAYSTTTKSLNGVELGDTVTLISKKNNVRTRQRVVKLYNYYQDEKEDKCEIANSILTFEDLQREAKEEMDEQTQQIQDSISDIDVTDAVNDAIDDKNLVTQDDLSNYPTTDDMNSAIDDALANGGTDEANLKKGENLVENGDFSEFLYSPNGVATLGSLKATYKIYGWDAGRRWSSDTDKFQIGRNKGLDNGDCLYLQNCYCQMAQQCILLDDPGEYLLIQGYAKNVNGETDAPTLAYDFFDSAEEDTDIFGDTYNRHNGNLLNQNDDTIKQQNSSKYPGWWEYKKVVKVPEGAVCVNIVISPRADCYADRVMVKRDTGSDYSPSKADTKRANSQKKQTITFTEDQWGTESETTPTPSLTLDNPFGTKNINCSFINDDEGCAELLETEITSSNIIATNDRSFNGRCIIEYLG